MKKNVFGCKQYQDKVGVLIAQLGTPDAPTKKALKPYLKQFLSDPRVIEANRFVWWFLLRFVILTRRPKRSAALYKRIWWEEGSPLLKITEQQTEKTRRALEERGLDVEVEFGMRYGKPSLESAIDKLIESGCTKILLFPMYPQYSGTTTGSTFDAVFGHLLKRRFIPTLRVAEPYYRHPSYIRALAATINEGMEKLAERPDKLVFSYHGIPEAYVDKGDPYCCMCTETTREVMPFLAIPKKDVIHTFQSRFGKDPWLVPYTDETIEGLAKSDVKRLAVACPGFTTDCLETLDEIGNEAREEFEENGGEQLDLIPCLNDHPVWIEAMSDIIIEELGSWLQNRSSACADTPCVCPIEEAKKCVGA